MLKQNTCPIEASNIANLGSELEHEIKLAAAKCEHAWDGIGQRPALLIWRYAAVMGIKERRCVRMLEEAFEV